MNIFSKNIQQLRKSKDYTQGDLADLLKVKKNTISNYENGVSEPSFDMLYEIIKIFDIETVDILFTDLETVNQKPTPDNTMVSSVNCGSCKEKDRTIVAMEKALTNLEKVNDNLEKELAECRRQSAHPNDGYRQTGT